MHRPDNHAAGVGGWVVAARESLVAFVTAALMWGLYLLLVYPPPVIALKIGVGAALFAAAGATVARVVLWPGYRFERRVWSPLAGLAGRVLRDVAQLGAGVLLALAHRRRIRGTARWDDFDTTGDAALVRGRRAVSTLLASAAPGSLAAGFDANGTRLLMHELVRSGATDTDAES